MVVWILAILCTPRMLNCCQNRTFPLKESWGDFTSYSKKVQHLPRTLQCPFIRPPLHTHMHINTFERATHYRTWALCILLMLTRLVCTDVCRRAEDPRTLDVEDGVSSPRAAPAVLRRVVLKRVSAHRHWHPSHVRYSTTHWIVTSESDKTTQGKTKHKPKKPKKKSVSAGCGNVWFDPTGPECFLPEFYSLKFSLPNHFL